MRERRLRDVAQFLGVALILGAVSTAGGLALANDGNTIHACTNNATGALRLVQSADDCRAPEAPVEWSVQGPQGPQGPQGAAGPEGPPGVLNIHVVEKESPLKTSGRDSLSAYCPEGEKALDVGFLATEHGPNVWARSDAISINELWTGETDETDGVWPYGSFGTMMFTVDETKIGEGRSVKVTLFVTCAQIG